MRAVSFHDWLHPRPVPYLLLTFSGSGPLAPQVAAQSWNLAALKQTEAPDSRSFRIKSQRASSKWNHKMNSLAQRLPGWAASGAHRGWKST